MRLPLPVRLRLRGLAEALDRVPAPALEPPPLRLALVYRARNAGTVAALLAGLPPGTDVRLWALDEAVPGLPTAGVGPGLRFVLLNRLLAGAPDDGAWTVLADDDVRLVRGSLQQAAALCRAAGVDVGQPAHAWNSYVSHDHTRRRVLSLVREVWFVEQGPVVLLSPAARARVLPLPEDVGMGWGIEYRWSSLRRDGLRLGIVDAVALRHLAPAGAGYDQAEARAVGHRLRREQGYGSVTELLRTTGVWRVDHAATGTAAPWLSR